jgi:cell shape-determining protein MreC
VSSTPQTVNMDRLTLAICVFLSLVLLALPIHQKTSVADILSRVLTSPWTRSVRFVTEMSDLHDDNARLLARVTALETDLAGTGRMQRERDQVRLALGFQNQHPARLVPCEVERLHVDRQTTLVKIRSTEPLAWSIHQPVVTSEGLIGRVVKISASDEAWVELMTSPGFAVCVEVQRTGLPGILRPQGGSLTLTLVGRDEDIVVGDVLVTSDLTTAAGGDLSLIPTMPRGIPVANVSSVGADGYSLFKSIDVRSTANVIDLEVVFAVLGKGDWYLNVEADSVNTDLMTNEDVLPDPEVGP